MARKPDVESTAKAPRRKVAENKSPSARLGLKLEAEKCPAAASYIHQMKRDWRRNLNAQFLPKPYTLEEFQMVLGTALKLSPYTKPTMSVSAIK
jgi:hypothetical protein